MKQPYKDKTHYVPYGSVRTSTLKWNKAKRTKSWCIWKHRCSLTKHHHTSQTCNTHYHHMLQALLNMTHTPAFLTTYLSQDLSDRNHQPHLNLLMASVYLLHQLIHLQSLKHKAVLKPVWHCLNSLSHDVVVT